MGGGVNAVTSQISALLIGLFVMYYVYKYAENLFLEWGMLVCVAIYAHILYTYGNLSQWDIFENWVCVGVLRAIAGLMAGALTYTVVAKKVGKLSCSKIIVINLFCLFCCGMLVGRRTVISSYDVVVFVPIFSLLVASGLYLQSSSALFNKVAIWLGELSYPVYLVHYPICQIMQNYYESKNYFFDAGLYVVIVLVSACCLKLVKYYGGIKDAIKLHCTVL